MDGSLDRTGPDLPPTGQRRGEAAAPTGLSAAGAGSRRLALRLSPAVARDVWRYLGLFLGRRGRRRLLLLQPPMAAVLAATDLVVLLAVVRMILMMVAGEQSTTFSFLGTSLTVSFTGLALLALGASALSVVTRVVESRFVGHVSASAASSARQKVLGTWFDADWEHMRDVRLGQLQQMLGLNSHIALQPVNLFAVASLSLISLVVYGIIVVVLAPIVALLFVGLGAAVAAAFGPLRAAVKRASKSSSDAVSELQLTATSYAQLNRELHAYGVARAAAGRLGQVNEQVRVSLGRVRSLTRLTPGVFQQVLLASVVMVVAIAQALDVDARSFGTAAILALRSLTYVQQLTAVTHSFLEGRPYLEEVTATIRQHQGLRREQGTEPLASVERIELRAVSFSYAPGGPDALSDVDLTLVPGDWLAVVGPSGSGKTTLANILVRLLSPTRGEHLVNGVPASRIATADWTRAFALLSQEPTLLRATVGENISFHRPDSDGAVASAARRAAIADEVSRLPDGLDSFVGDGYSGLSGGQRQRVALARALFDNPACLVLDEPTSALDSRNAQLLETSLAALPPESIVVVISHQAGLLARCTRYVRIVDGRVVAAGSADEVEMATLIEP